MTKELHQDNLSKPLITVSIVSHGDSKKVVCLLESMQTFEQASSIQVIITDNLNYELPDFDESPWLSLSMIRNVRPHGFARNHNRAFELAEGKYFCVLNPDVVFKQAAFNQLLQRLDTPQADIVAPLIVDSQGIIQDSFRDLPTPIDIILRRLPGYKVDDLISASNDFIQPDWLSGIFLLMRSDTYRRLGGLNEKYKLYFEDVEFCTRARLAGLKLLVDTSICVQHDAHRASRRKPIYLFWHIQSAIRFFTSSVYKKAFQNFKKYRGL